MPRGANWLRRQVAEAATSAPPWEPAADSGSAAAGCSPASAQEAPVPIGGSWENALRARRAALLGEPEVGAEGVGTASHRGGELGSSRKPRQGRGFPW
jgi:hypothetical protein